MPADGAAYLDMTVIMGSSPTALVGLKPQCDGCHAAGTVLLGQQSVDSEMSPLMRTLQSYQRQQGIPSRWLKQQVLIALEHPYIARFAQNAGQLSGVKSIHRILGKGFRREIQEFGISSPRLAHERGKYLRHGLTRAPISLSDWHVHPAEPAEPRECSPLHGDLGRPHHRSARHVGWPLRHVCQGYGAG